MVLQTMNHILQLWVVKLKIFILWSQIFYLTPFFLFIFLLILKKTSIIYIEIYYIEVKYNANL